MGSVENDYQVNELGLTNVQFYTVQRVRGRDEQGQTEGFRPRISDISQGTRSLGRSKRLY